MAAGTARLARPSQERARVGAARGPVARDSAPLLSAPDWPPGGRECCFPATELLGGRGGGGARTERKPDTRLGEGSVLGRGLWL